MKTLLRSRLFASLLFSPPFDGAVSPTPSVLPLLLVPLRKTQQSTQILLERVLRIHESLPRSLELHALPLILGRLGSQTLELLVRLPRDVRQQVGNDEHHLLLDSLQVDGFDEVVEADVVDCHGLVQASTAC